MTTGSVVASRARRLGITLDLVVRRSSRLGVVIPAALALAVGAGSAESVAADAELYAFTPR